MPNYTAMTAAHKLYVYKRQTFYLNYYKVLIIFQQKTKIDFRLVNLPFVNILPTKPGLFF